jgi:hypothetical protein
MTCVKLVFAESRVSSDWKIQCRLGYAQRNPTKPFCCWVSFLNPTYDFVARFGLGDCFGCEAAGEDIFQKRT